LALANIIIDGTDDTIGIEEPLDVSRLKLSRSFGVVQLVHTLRASTQIVKYTSHNDAGQQPYTNDVLERLHARQQQQKQRVQHVGVFTHTHSHTVVYSHLQQHTHK
jgi:hypothetical protein